jgi:hypothetical protein
MPEYRMTYKRCCICGKKFPITREAHGSPLEFINSQPCKCADCQGEKNVAVNTKTDRKYLNDNSYGRFPEDTSYRMKTFHSQR